MLKLDNVLEEYLEPHNKDRHVWDISYQLSVFIQGSILYVGKFLDIHLKYYLVRVHMEDLGLLQHMKD